MAQAAFILGGTGHIGRAVAARLLEHGWKVTVAARNPNGLPSELREQGVQAVRVDRTEPGSLESAFGGADLLVDVVAFTEGDARQLIGLADDIGSLVALSSASVYADADGRTLDEATSEDDFPALPVPITERQPTVPAGDATYSTRKVAIEHTLLDGPLRTTIVRPGAIHGPGARLAREWFFVKRALDGRRLVCLAHRGHSRFHTTSVGNLAELIRLAAHRPSNRILNCGDPEPPSVLEISRAVAAAMEHEWTELLLAGAAAGDVGDHPWNVPRPFVLDTVEAEIELGYRPVTTYARAVPETCRWLVEATRDRDWRDVLPPTAEHLASSFDYAAEDAFVAGLSGQARPG